MTKFKKRYFLLLMKYQHVADVVVEYYSCATCARGVGGEGGGGLHSPKGATRSQLMADDPPATELK